MMGSHEKVFPNSEQSYLEERGKKLLKPCAGRFTDLDWFNLVKVASGTVKLGYNDQGHNEFTYVYNEQKYC